METIGNLFIRILTTPAGRDICILMEAIEQFELDNEGLNFGLHISFVSKTPLMCPITALLHLRVKFAGEIK